MPQIRAEQIQNETVIDLQIAVNAAIQQSKIEDWTSDPAGWISEGIVKVSEVEPTWDGSQEGQLFYINSTDELHLGIGSDPWHIVIGSPSSYGWDAELTVKNGTQAEDYSGGSGTQFRTTTEEFTIDGSDIYVYLNGSMQRMDASYDYTLIDTRTVQFTHDIYDEDTITIIVVISPLIVGYATKAWVINRYEEDIVDVGAERVRVKPSGSITSITVQAALEEIQTDVDNIVAGTYDINFSMDDTYNDGSTVEVDDSDVVWNIADTKSFTVAADSGVTDLLNITAAAAGDSIILGADTQLKGDLLPETTETYDLGSSGAKWAEIHAQTGYFDAATVYLGSTAQLKYDGSNFQFTNDGITFLDAMGTAPGEPIIIQSDIHPTPTRTLDLGSTSLAFQDVYINNSIQFHASGDAGRTISLSRVVGATTNLVLELPSGFGDDFIIKNATANLFTVDAAGAVDVVNALSAGTIASDGTLQTGGNVGINQAPGTEALEVTGNIEFTGNLIPAAGDTSVIGSETNLINDIYMTDSIYFRPVGAGDEARIYRSLNGSDTELRIQIASGAADKIVLENGANVALLTVSGTGEVEIAGNLTVSGTTTSVESTVTQIADSSFEIKTADTPVDGNASYEVQRASGNAKLLWNDATHYWQAVYGVNAATTSNIVTEANGNAPTTTKWQTARTLSLTGDVTGSMLVDGTANASITAVIANDSHTHDTRYYTETESDTRFVNAAGDSMSGNLTMGSNTVSINDGTGIAHQFTQSGASPGLLLRTATNPAAGSNIFSIESSGAGVRFAVQHDGEVNTGINPAFKIGTSGTIVAGNTAPTGTAALGYNGYFYATRVYNAVWNDIADFFEVQNEVEVEVGRTYVIDENGDARISNSYMEEGIIGVASDTFGYGLGQKNIKNEIPIGVAGIVLAFTDRDDYRVGAPLTVGPNGQLVEFKQEDKVQYPERIVATFFRKETKETVGPEDQAVPVNGRCWVKIK